MTGFGSTTWQIEPARGPRPFRPGDIVLDSWEVVRLIGEGGYGSVYEIRKNTYGVDSVSALKVIQIPKERGYVDALRSMGSTMGQIEEEIRAQVNRAVTEVQTMKRLIDHPAVVRCEDFSVVQYESDNSWDIFIRMELLTPLTAWMEDHPVTEAAVRQIGATMADLLQYCAEERILHRDIKPGNIFMNRRSSCKLGDFGLARTLSAGSSTHSHGVGTDAFMAPEVASSQHYDTHADMYSLGLVLYWMLNKRRLPFMDQGMSFTQSITARITGKPIPPINGVERGLMDAVLKACAFRPEDRFADAEDLRQALLGTAAPAQRQAEEKPDTPEPPQDPSPVQPSQAARAQQTVQQTQAPQQSRSGGDPAPHAAPAAPADPWEGIRERYPVGSTCGGTVTAVSRLNATVELEPGVTGSVHISECSDEPVSDISQVVRVGRQVRVRVLRVDGFLKSISLSIRQAEPEAAPSGRKAAPQGRTVPQPADPSDPWGDAARRYPVGATFAGVVVGISGKFGATVQLEPGLEGTVHISECSDEPVSDVGQAVRIHQEVNVKVLRVDPGYKRMSLSIRQAASVPSAAPLPQAGAKRGDPPGNDTSHNGTAATRQTAAGSGLKAGDRIVLGSYWQDDSGEKKPVTWLVLRTEASDALVISEKALDVGPYEAFWLWCKEDVTWEGSQIRQWVNGEFLDSCFTPEDRQRIRTTRVDNGPGQGGSARTNGGPDTSDRLFFLSCSEAESLFSSAQSRCCGYTGYAEYQGIDTIRDDEPGPTCRWWLRTPGPHIGDAFCVAPWGEMEAVPAGTEEFSCVGARPAMWICAEGLTAAPQPEENAAPAEYITFGRYPRVSGGSPESIRWRVLEKQGDRKLVVSECALDAMPFGKSKFASRDTWQKSPLRVWLQDEFLRKAFDRYERDRIFTVNLDNGGAMATQDQVFLLSAEELKRCLPGSRDRKCGITPYGKSRGIFNQDTCTWWLRGPIDQAGRCACVLPDGFIGDNSVDCPNCGVRPAMWVDIPDSKPGQADGEEAIPDLSGEDYDPWRDPSYRPGAVVEATVFETFAAGMYVTLAEGMSALISAEACPFAPGELVNGNLLDVRILEMDREKKRVSVEVADSRWPAPARSSAPAPARVSAPAPAPAPAPVPAPAPASASAARTGDSPWVGSSSNDFPRGFLLPVPYVKPPEKSDPVNFKLRETRFNTGVSCDDFGSFPAPEELHESTAITTVTATPMCVLIKKEYRFIREPQTWTTALMYDTIRSITFSVEGRLLKKTATAVIAFRQPDVCPLRIRNILVNDLRKLMDLIAEYAHITVTDGIGQWPEMDTDGRYDLALTGYRRDETLNVIRALRTWDPRMDLATAKNTLDRVPVTLTRGAGFTEARRAAALLNKGGAVCKVTRA